MAAATRCSRTQRWLSSSEQDEQRRADLVRYVGDAGDVPLDRMQTFLESLAYYQIDVVAMSREGQGNVRVKSLVRFAGFERVSDADWEQILRPDAALDAQEAAARGRDGVPPRGRRGRDAGARAVRRLAALQKLGCARVVAAPQTMGSLTPQEFDYVLRLERGAYLASETDGGDDAWLLREFDRRGIEVVVSSAGPWATGASRRCSAPPTSSRCKSSRPILSSGARHGVENAPLSAQEARSTSPCRS